jgi:hypothetical protein
LKFAVDPKGQEISPLLHLVAEFEVSPEYAVVTICGQRFKECSTTERDLDPEVLRHLCFQCARLAKIDVSLIVEALRGKT